MRWSFELHFKYFVFQDLEFLGSCKQRECFCRKFLDAQRNLVVRAKRTTAVVVQMALISDRQVWPIRRPEDWAPTPVGTDGVVHLMRSDRKHKMFVDRKQERLSFGICDILLFLGVEPTAGSVPTKHFSLCWLYHYHCLLHLRTDFLESFASETMLACSEDHWHFLKFVSCLLQQRLNVTIFFFRKVRRGEWEYCWRFRRLFLNIGGERFDLEILVDGWLEALN